MDFLATPPAGLAGLFLSSFLAATLLPGGSEIALFALLKLHPDLTTPALALATIGNTLGGMTAAAGWLRLPWWPCMLWMALGKGLRYIMVALGAGVA